MSSLAAVLDTLTPDADAFSIEAPPDWSQGRTLYGGMTAALMYEAMRRSHEALPPLRSAQLSFIGPASGKLTFRSTLLRRGRSSALIGADCVSEEGPAARAMFVLGAARESALVHDYLPMPKVDAPEACGPFRREGAPAKRGFWNNFQTRLAAGGRLFEVEAPRPEFTVWTRFLDAGGADPTSAALAIADCLPPAAMVQFPTPAPISTMTWTVDMMRTPSSADGWRLLWASSEHAGEGYSMQAMTMWSEAGEPIAVGRQAIAIFA